MARILMVIPTAGGIHERTHAVSCILSQRADVIHLTAQGRPIDYVRNGAIRKFLSEKHFTHLFLLDSDTEPPLDCLDRLLILNVPLASGCYPVLMPNGLHWAIANKNRDGHYRLLERLISIDEPFEADAGGAGCLFIKRDVFDKVHWPWFKWIENKDGSQVSEDINFFKKCNDAGLRVTFDPQVICNHFKQLNLTALMRAKMKIRKEKTNVDSNDR